MNYVDESINSVCQNIELERMWMTIEEDGYYGGGSWYVSFDTKYASGAYGALTAEEAWRQESTRYMHNGKNMYGRPAGTLSKLELP